VFLDDAAVGLTLVKPPSASDSSAPVWVGTSAGGGVAGEFGTPSDGTCPTCSPVTFATSRFGREVVVAAHLEDFVARGVAVLVQLRDVDSGDLFNVGTTHLYWDPTKPLVKLAQVWLWPSSVAKVSNVTECERFGVGGVRADWVAQASHGQF
jgi:hypothetical protein